jgi:outer membrane protein OmpA-like peptidoglycan-associated protein
VHEESIMKKQVIALVIGSLLATSSYAGPRNRAPKNHETNVAPKEEAIGVGSGAAIGAMAGGPVGFVIGAAFGGWLGDRMHSERRARRLAEERSVEATGRVGQLEQRLAASEQAAAEKDAMLYSERSAHRQDLKEALSVEVFFRTEESGIGTTTEERLTRLAGLVEPMEGAVIRLEGHADARGTETYNAALSTARAEAVRDALIRGGMPAERVIVAAIGEAAAVAGEQDTDGMALDRRVQVHVIDRDDANRVALEAAL